jgi:predicted ribosome quality control (RQC) complex YloA/Tae2 family protein
VGDGQEKQSSPNNFTSKLKKHLKGKRFHEIKQLGAERMIQIEFGYKGEHGTEVFYLILEMYAKGNIVLCDEQLNIVTLTRNYKLGPEVKVMPKEVYPMDSSVKYLLEKYPVDEETLDQVIEQVKANPKYNSLANLITKYLHFVHQVLAEQYLVAKLWDPKKKVGCLQNKEKKEEFLEMLKDLKGEFEKDRGTSELTWYSYWSCNVKGSKTPGKPMCFDFSLYPYKYSEEGVTMKEEKNPSKMMEDYFNQFQVEENLEEKQERVEKVAMQKYERIKNDQETRLAEIQKECDSLLKQAQMIEKWMAEVQGIISTVVEMIKCGLSNIVKASIAQGQKQGDELALMVKSVDIGKLQLKLSLEDDKREAYLVMVDLRQNASKNAQLIYNQRKKLMEKEEKTRKATKEVLKKAHALAKKEIRNQKLKLGIRRKKKRKQLWFEKFYWFLSGGRYLIISARDAQQNELLVKRYANKTDVVLHAQIQGCAFTVIKDLEKQNLKGMRKARIMEALKDEKYLTKMKLRPEEKISPEELTEKVEAMQSEIPPFYVLLEAATATLGHSKAWVKKVAVEVYWVFGEQVSKTAPSGLSLPTGSFMIYGKKNFVPVHKMEMGFGFLFKVEGEGGKRESERKEMKKQSWVEENLFGESDVLEEEKGNQKSMRKYGGEDEVGGLLWKAVEEIKRSMRKGDQEEDDGEKGKEKEEEEETGMEDRDEPEESVMQSQIEQSIYMEHGNPELIETKFSRKKKGQVKIKKKTKDERKKEKEEKKKEEEKIEEQQVNKKKTKKRTKKNKKKMKKYLERYGDETKEETEIRMKLMGFKKNYIMEKKKEEFTWNKKDENSQASKEGELLIIDFSETNSTKNQSKPEKESVKTEEADSNQNTTQNSKKIHVPKNIDSDSEEEDQEVAISNDNPFRLYTGYPKEGDQITDVIPVCSAYMTLSKYKYKVKLLPGFMKRGKIWKMVEGLFMQQKGVNEEEKKGIKGVTDNEAVQQLIGGCKVQAPGLQKIVQKQKKAKKKNRKNKK